MNRTVVNALQGMLNKEFTFPFDGLFVVRGVAFCIDEKAEEKASFLGPTIRLWADRVLVHEEHKITVRGGMGTQVHDSYGPLWELHVRVETLRARANAEAQEAKRAEVLKALQ